MRIRLFILTQYMNVTDRKTDGRTDRVNWSRLEIRVFKKIMRKTKQLPNVMAYPLNEDERVLTYLSVFVDALRFRFCSEVHLLLCSGL